MNIRTPNLHEQRKLYKDVKKTRIINDKINKLTPIVSSSPTSRYEILTTEIKKAFKVLEYYKCPDDYDLDKITDIYSLVDSDIELVDRAKFKIEEIKNIPLDSIWCHNYCFVHFDMNCFFAAVEIRDKPTIKDCPVGVGTEAMLATTNYEARKYGINAGTPSFIAKKLCPNLIIVPPCFEKYHLASSQFFQVLKKYDVNIISMGLDEANMDISHIAAWKSIKKLEEFLNKIRNEVYVATSGLWCTGGAAITRALAKNVCSINKPDSNFILTPTISLLYVLNLNASKLCGVGNAKREVLSSLLSVKNCFEAIKKLDYFKQIYTGKVLYNNFLRTICGLHYMKRVEKKKSTGASVSIVATNNLGEILRIIEKLSIKLAETLEKDCVIGHNLMTVVGFLNFKTDHQLGGIENTSYTCLMRVAFSNLVGILNKKREICFNASKVFDNYLTNRLFYHETIFKSFKVRYLGLRVNSDKV